MKTTKKPNRNPFMAKLACEKGELITGIEVCFAGKLEYVALECNPIQPGYAIETSRSSVENSKASPNTAVCPDKKSIITLELKKKDGEVIAKLGCAGIVKKE